MVGLYGCGVLVAVSIIMEKILDQLTAMNWAAIPQQDYRACG